MCGIAGVYNLNEQAEPISEQLLWAMANTMTHRGPDEGGVKAGWRFGLANRRLKIIDLRTGQQPLSNEDGCIWVAFNGEIYNYRALRERLLALEHVFRTASDTEVIVHAYEAWDMEAFSQFNGQFALAIYDGIRNRLVLARDRLGIKPLYYTVQDGCLIFGSEVKAILTHPSVSARPNYRAVTSYLSYRYPLGRDSWYEDIYMLQPGKLLIAEGGQVRHEAYWQLPVVSSVHSTLTESDMIAEVRYLLDDAVQYRMISDVPLGAYLSGGLDSSIIVALMAQHSSEPIKTFSVGFEDEQFNEFKYARMVADWYSTEHHEIVLQQTDYIALLTDLIGYKDAPLSVPNEIPLYAMSKELKRYITVVLSGEGADELFGGYGRIFRSPYDFERMQSLQNGDLHLGAAERKSLLTSLRELYGGVIFDSRMEHFLYLYAYTPLAAQRELFTSEFLDAIGNDVGLCHFWREQFAHVESLSHYEQYKFLFQKFHLVGLLLRVDMTTMATAVEARVPFVDHRLVEYVLTNVPFDYLIRWRSAEHQRKAAALNSAEISEKYDITKYLLRRAFEKDLPEEMLTRKKVGFPVPLDRWMEADFGDFARDILLDKKTRDRGIFRIGTLQRWLEGDGPKRRLGQIIWMLVNLEIWFRTYIDGS